MLTEYINTQLNKYVYVTVYSLIQLNTVFIWLT